MEIAYYDTPQSAIVSFTSFLLDPNILFSDQFSGSRGLRSSHEERDQFSHAYRTTEKNYISLYFKVTDIYISSDCR